MAKERKAHDIFRIEKNRFGIKPPPTQPRPPAPPSQKSKANLQPEHRNLLLAIQKVVNDIHLDDSAKILIIKDLFNGVIESHLFESWLDK